MIDVGITLPAVGPAGDREFILMVAEAADRLGYHSIWTTDHVVFPANRVSAYPYERSTTGQFLHAGIAWLDPIAVMGVVTGATERVQIGTSVLIVPYRNPLVLANELATLDRLSSGRILLGVGVGWMDEEFEALGVPKRERGRRTDEYLEAMRLLWAGPGPTSFEGRSVRFQDVVLGTAPVRAGGPPVFVGGNSEAALRRAGKSGNGWMGFEVFPDELPAARDAIQRAAKDSGRDPLEVTLSVVRGLVPPFEVSNFTPERRCIAGGADDIRAELKRYEDEGVDLVIFQLAMLPGEMIQTMEWFVEEVRHSPS